MGELADAAHEAALMEHITSANIACGGHAGDEATMERTARLALERGVRIGAHPGYPDPAHFGRLEMPLSEAEIAETVYAQIRRLEAVVSAVGGQDRARQTSRRALQRGRARCRRGARHRRGRERWNADATAVRPGRIAHARHLARHGAARRGRGLRRPPLRARWLAAQPQVPGRPDHRPGGGRRRRPFAWRVAGQAETICVHGDTPGSVAILRACRAALEAL